ncbi:MAG: hypothetical protein ACE5H3_10960 [Planctomycetota bacterium]
MKRNRRGKKGLEEGSILLVTLLITGIIAFLSLTMGSSVRNQLNLIRDNTAGLHAELAAQSGLEFARRKLLKDPTWPGTDGVPVGFGGTSSFTVERRPGDSSWTHPTKVGLLVKGMMGDAEVRLGTTIAVDPGDPVRTKALASLGGEVDFRQSQVNGSMFITDSLGVVFDYIPGTGWVQGGASTLGNFRFIEDGIQDNLLKYDATTQYLSDGTPELVVKDPVYMPAWDLDEYLVPGPDRVIFDNPGNLQGVTMDRTAVFVLDPGADLTLDNVNLLGGAVVYTEHSWDLRGNPRNQIFLKHEVIIGGGSEGVDPNLALMAPAAQVTTRSGLGQVFTGFSFLHSIDAQQVNKFEMTGQLLVVNQIHKLKHAILTYKESVALSPPPGASFHRGMPSVDVLEVTEEYDPFDPDLDQ